MNEGKETEVGVVMPVSCGVGEGVGDKEGAAWNSWGHHANRYLLSRDENIFLSFPSFLDFISF